jgi:lysophospholipase L1-like esterase
MERRNGGFRRAALALLAALLLAGPASATPDDKSCAAPHELERLRTGLARTATRLARHENLTVVTIGSSSTVGYGASSPDLSYPSQFAAELQRRMPDQPVEVRNEGVNGETSIDMVTRFERDVIAAAPELVIWQVGTNAVLRDFDIARYRQVVRTGIVRLKDAGFDVILMDMQFAPKVLAHPLYRDMEHSLAALAKEQGIPVFRRFALMQYWVESGQLDFITMLSPDGLHMNDLSYGCIGRALAEAVIERAASPIVTSRR